jgi:hypothetical protein
VPLQENLGSLIPGDDLSQVLTTLGRRQSDEKGLNDAFDRMQSIRKVSVDSFGSLASSVSDNMVMGEFGASPRGIHLPCHTVLPGQRYPMMVLKRR